MIVLESDGTVSEDDIIELLLDYDVEDIKTEDGSIILKTSPEAYREASDALMKNNYKINMNELTYVPLTNVSLDEQKAVQCLKIIELLEDHDDVQEVYSNYDISDEIMAKIGG